MTRFQVYQDDAGEWRWRFRAGNGKVIAVSSEGYVEKTDCLHGLELLRTHGPVARVETLDARGNKVVTRARRP